MGCCESPECYLQYDFIGTLLVASLLLVVRPGAPSSDARTAVEDPSVLFLYLYLFAMKLAPWTQRAFAKRMPCCLRGGVETKRKQQFSGTKKTHIAQTRLYQLLSHFRWFPFYDGSSSIPYFSRREFSFRVGSVNSLECRGEHVGFPAVFGGIFQ